MSVNITSLLAMLAIEVACATCAAASERPYGPVLSGDESRIECAEALRLARYVFASRSPRLYAPTTLPANLRDQLVLGSTMQDVSGGDSTAANPQVFEALPRLDIIRNVYWAKRDDDGVRVVVTTRSMGWRGDLYNVYLLEAQVLPSDFQNSFKEGDVESRGYKSFIGPAWRPPLIFAASRDGPLWIVYFGEPYWIVGDWTVYSAIKDTPSCSISFHPKVSDAAELLPVAVRSWAHALGRTIGPGENEGTLQSTARLRIQIQHALANAALRPWALSEADVYNSRPEVDAGLKEWSRHGQSFAREYEAIQSNYPSATRALTEYYAQKFDLAREEASVQAEWVMDILYRANFAFHSDEGYFRYDNVNTNPWPHDLSE